MKARVFYILYMVRTSYWFVPALLAAAAIVLSQAVLLIDRQVIDGTFWRNSWFLQIGTEGARLLLSTIAGSMITVTSLVFSLTLIALTMTSSQFGPRLLTNFMQDRVMQFVLGAFLATFLYSLIALGSIEKATEENFVPYLTIATAMAFAIASFGILILFIHHIANALQADTVIANVTAQLHKSIVEQFDDRGDGSVRDDAPSPDLAQVECDGVTVRCDKTGYIQAIDYDSLVNLAKCVDGLIWLKKRAGHYIVEGEPLALVVAPRETDTEFAGKLSGACVVGRTRTMVQDLEFAIGSIVEIALRALSHGINDTRTALACIDNISSALCEAVRRRPPPMVKCDSDGVARVIANPITFDGLVNTAFDQIRQCSQSNVAVAIRLMEALRRIAEFTVDEGQREPLLRQAQMIKRSCSDCVREPNDLKDIESRFGELSARLGSGHLI